MCVFVCTKIYFWRIMIAQKSRSLNVKMQNGTHLQLKTQISLKIAKYIIIHCNIPNINEMSKGHASFGDKNKGEKKASSCS